MGNLKNFNFNKIDAFLSNSEYYDFYLAQDEGGMYSLFDGNLSDNCTVVHYDFNEDAIYSGDVNINETIYSLVTWTGATNSGYTFNTFGLTGIDNGYITFVKENCDTTNTALTSTLTGSVITIPSGDTRLFLNPVTGMTGQIGYPMSLASDTTAGRYAKLCGGFYQGYYKLDGYSYEILPTRVPKEWAAEFWLKKDKAEPCDVFEVITDMTTASYSQEVTTILSGHNLTTDDVILVNGAGEPFDTIDGAPFYKILSIIDENTFVYGNRVGSFSDSSEIGYIGRFTEVDSYDSVVFSQNDGVISYPDRWFGSLTGHNFNIGDMLSFDLVSYGGGGGFILVDNYTAYVTGIVNDDLFEVKFGTDSINDSPGIVANITRYIEDGCNKEYEMYSNVEMTKEASGNTITVNLVDHNLSTGDTFSIYNSSSAFTTNIIYQLNNPKTMGFGVVSNVIDSNHFEFTHHYLNDSIKGVISDYGTILIYEVDTTENIFVDDGDGGSPFIKASYDIKCFNENITTPIKVDGVVFDLTPNFGSITGNIFPLQHKYSFIFTVDDDEFTYGTSTGVSYPSSGYADITFYKPKKKIPLTLNDIYPENKGFFFYMGTRAENKFWNQFEGLNTGSTSACTGSNILNTTVNYVINGDFSSGGNTPDSWDSSAWIKEGDSAYIATSGPPTISLPISQDLNTPLSGCSYQLMFDIDILGGDDITFSTNISGITEVFTSGGTGLTYNFDLTDEITPVSAVTFTINGSDFVTGQISNVRIYAFDKTNDWCTIPKEIDVSIMGDMGYPINLDPPALQITEVDNPFLIYGRASNNPTCGSCGSVISGYGNKTVCDYSGGSVITTGYTKVDIEDETNPFLVYGRASNNPTCGNCGSEVSGLGNKTVCDDTSDFEYLTELDRDADIIDNAIGFRIKDDGSIGYRALKMTGYCSGDTYVTGVTVEEQYSVSGVVSDDIWHHIAIRFVMPPYDECELEIKGPRKGRLMFYVDCRLKFVAEGVDEFIAKRLNEYKDKQLGVPFNISLGGGSQGLLESMTFDGQDPDDLGLSIESNFAGTFIGDISQFRFNICGLSWCELKNNCKVEENRYGK